jgi:hypothetical protein
MLGRFLISMRVFALIALSASILSPPLRAEPATKTPNLTPMDYPLSPSAQSKLPAPQLPQPRQTATPLAPLQVTGPHPSQQPGPPSPLLGKAPPLPLSVPMFRRLQKNPALLQEWQKGLKPVTSKPAPPPAPRRSGGTAPVGGTWSLAPSAPGSPPLTNPLLLTDGTVIAQVSCSGTWWKLIPDYTGSYTNGSWSQIASLPSGYTPRFFSSAMLPDGRVIIEGGEYNTGCNSAWTNLGAIYNPLFNTWTSITPPAGWGNIGDAQSVVLANGTYMQANCCSSQDALLNPSALTWTPTGTGKFDENDEEGWTLLPNGSVLTADAYVQTGTCGQNTEIYAPGTGAWSSAGNTPSILADCGNGQTYEIGPQVLRPDGKVVAFGGTTCGSCLSGNTTVITPSAIFNTANSTWLAGPNIPPVTDNNVTNNYTLADAPATLLPNGNVLFAASPNYTAFVTPTHFFEVSTTNSIAQVAEPTDASSFNSFQWNFLVLPTGQIMALETDGSNVWIYTPSGSANAAWMPAVTSAPASLVSGGTFTLNGTQLNGLSQGASYGDDAQAATNYPIIEIVNNATGHVVFGRSFNFSTMTVAPGVAGSASFTMPENVEPGPSSLYAIANGIASAPVSLNLERSLYAKPADFNGDGKTDILWRDLFGTMVIWEMNGGQVVASVGGQNVSKDWTIVGTGDFNGDGKSDILWRNTNGTVAIWEMNGGQVLASVGVGVVGNDWTIAGTGDFFGTGHSNCILWRNTNGTIVIWEMNGGAVLASVGGQVVTNDWTIVGIGDFNGDGKSDILWRNTNGTVVIWEMNGGAVVANVNVALVTNDWTIVGTGDFNGDGKSDVLWRNTNGTVVIWEMNGGQVLASVNVALVTNDWTIAGTGDFNGDGKSDILWRNTNGNMAIWEMNGGQVLASVTEQGVSAFQWTLVQ